MPKTFDDDAAITSSATPLPATTTSSTSATPASSTSSFGGSTSGFNTPASSSPAFGSAPATGFSGSSSFSSSAATPTSSGFGGGSFGSVPSTGGFGSTTGSFGSSSSGFGSPAGSFGGGFGGQQQIGGVGPAMPGDTSAFDSAIVASEGKEPEHWMKSFWRPAMGWLYMLICACDFMVFPVLWSLLQVFNHQPQITQWNPLTLQGAGFFHIAMGGILGIAAYGRTQEKKAGMQ